MPPKMKVEDTENLVKQYTEDPILSSARSIQDILNHATVIKSPMLCLTAQTFIVSNGNFYCVNRECRTKNKHVFINMFSWELIRSALQTHLRSHQKTPKFDQDRLIVIVFHENQPINIMRVKAFKEWIEANHTNKTMNPNGWKTLRARKQIKDIEKEIQKLQASHTIEPTIKIMEQILEGVYNIAIPNPQALNGRTGSATYGEVRFPQIKKFVEILNLGPTDTFIDLGSGVGTVLTTVAALSPVGRCIGIERENIPAQFAIEHKHVFEKLMQHFQKPSAEVELIKGDIFDDAYRSIICEQATVIFVNNAKFEEADRLKLAEIFLNCKDNTKIISIIPFTYKHEYTNKKYMKEGELAAIATPPGEIDTVADCVSWKADGVKFWITTIDRETKS